MTRMSCTGKDIEAKTELSDPTQALVVKCLEDARLNPVEGDVAVNIVEDNLFHLLLVSDLNCDSCSPDLALPDSRPGYVGKAGLFNLTKKA